MPQPYNVHATLAQISSIFSTIFL